MVVNDIFFEFIERYIVRLMLGIEIGGVRVEGIIEGVLMVEDSDNYYGLVFFGFD